MQDDDDENLQAGVTADDPDTPEGPPKDGKLKRTLLSHEYSDNTPVPKKRNRKITSTVWRTIKRLRNEALLGAILKVGQVKMERVWQRMVGAQSEQDEREASKVVHCEK